MPTTIYDSSLLTKRRADKTSANSFLTRIRSPNNTTGYAPLLGIYDNSILNTVKVGSITEYKKCDGGSVLVNPGCPCLGFETSPIVTILPPGEVTNIRYIIGSILLQWDAPTTGTGPFTYRITPYYKGTALNSVTTDDLWYRFTNLDEGKSYTFTVCAMNSGGQGPIVKTVDAIMMPPHVLSDLMTQGDSDSNDTALAIKYILNKGLNDILSYIASKNLGPTKSSRLMYLWSVSVVSGWNWVKGGPLSGIHDLWDWSERVSVISDKEAVTWMTLVMDYITPKFIPGIYASIFNCPNNIVETVKGKGQWESWKGKIDTWLLARDADGWQNASTEQPIYSDNWENTINIDGSTVTDFSIFGDVTKWTPLTVLGKKQKYLTYNWMDVSSTCLTEDDISGIKQSLGPANSQMRDIEVNEVLRITSTLTDNQKLQAEFWAGGPLTASPPCMMIWLWKEYIRPLSDITLEYILYSLLDLSIHLFEGGRVTWGLKKEFMEARPIQEIRRRYAGVGISGWNGNIMGDQWIPYQESNFVTPPFADFPSGHSHFSKAFALTMKKWFGDNIEHSIIDYDKMKIISPLFDEDQTGEYGTFLIKKGVSDIQKGAVPQIDLLLSWNTWEEMATSSGMSRLYGGIHCRTAHNASQIAAERVHNIIQQKWWNINE